ncbi:MAG: DUF1592 domain-containing protein [Lentisphaeraceae bacterium]|nr:DUF1592 domain-containing protein [Lentisphaeraceae bacterium]
MKLFTFLFVLLLSFNSWADPRIDYIKKFSSRYCADCHDDDLTKGGLDLAKYSLSLDTLDEEKMWSLIYDRVSHSEMPPPKKKKQPTKAEKEEFKTSLSSLLNESVLKTQQSSGRTIVRRLTREEYENSLRDLLHLPDLEIKSLLPEDNFTSGFDNVASGQDLSHVNIESYLKAAEYALDMAIALGPKPALYKYEKDIVTYRKYTKKHRHKRPKENGIFYFTAKKRPAVPPFMIEGFRVPYSGTYRISFKAFGSKFSYKELKSYPADKGTAQVATTFSGPKGGFRKHQSFTLPNDKCDDYITYLGHVNIGDNFAFNSSSLPTAANKPPTYMPQKREAIGVKGFKIEGPIFTQWPPKSHTTLYGKLKQAQWSSKISKFPPDNKLLRHRFTKPNKSLENTVIVSSNPTQDAQQLLERFMTKAFRRPVSTEKLTTYMSFFKSLQQQGYSFQDSLKKTYMGVLCDPHFLYFQEKPGKLDDYSLASRLSYFLWKSAPDEILIELANQGKLNQTSVIKSQVERMLKDQRSQRFVESFINQWLELRKFQSSTPDITLYPEYKSDTWLESSLQRETYSFFTKLITDNLSAKNIIDSDFIMINNRLAKLYGIEGVLGDEIRPVKVPSNLPRGGFMTQGAILKVTANGTTTSPITRGTWLAEKILGVHIPPPPAGVPAAEADLASAKTLKEQMAQHRNNSSCASCHVKIDPAGFALEKFDVMGATRENYRVLEGGKPVNEIVNLVNTEYQLGMEIDSSGTVVGGKKFDNIEQFKKIVMSDHKQITKHFLKNLITFATGSSIQFADRHELNKIVDQSKSNDGVRTLIHQVTQSKLFRNK